MQYKASFNNHTFVKLLTKFILDRCLINSWETVVNVMEMVYKIVLWN